MSNGVKYTCLSMEKNQQLGLYEKEYMKMAMLKHEQTFKQQVYELHRLYQIQKLLMKNIDMINVSTYEHKKLITNHGHNLQHIKMQKPLDLEQQGDDDKIELTLGLKSYKLKSDSGPNSFSSSSSGSSHTTKNTIISSTNTSSRTYVEDNKSGHQDRLQQHPPWILQSSSLYETN